MILFMLGLLIGGFVGVSIMVLFIAGSREDELMESRLRRI